MCQKKKKYFWAALLCVIYRKSTAPQKCSVRTAAKATRHRPPRQGGLQSPPAKEIATAPQQQQRFALRETLRIAKPSVAQECFTASKKKGRFLPRILTFPPLCDTLSMLRTAARIRPPPAPSQYGEMSEWFKELVLKICSREFLQNSEKP